MKLISRNQHPGNSNAPSVSFTTARLTLAAISAAMLSMLAAPAPASPQVNASTLGTYSGSPSQTASSGSVSVSRQNGDANGSVSGTAGASFGVLRVTANSAATNPNIGEYSVLSRSSASFQDDFFFNAPGLAGTRGQVTVRFLIDGTLSITTAGGPPAFSSVLEKTFASANYGIGVDGSFSNYTQTLRGDGTTGGTPFLGIMQEATLDFTYGQWLNNVSLRIGADAIPRAAPDNFTSSAAANLGNTAYWQGFASVRDANGAPVTNYTFQSTSGADYSQAIPEPGSALLLLLGACALHTGRTRRGVR